MGCIKMFVVLQTRQLTTWEDTVVNLPFKLNVSDAYIQCDEQKVIKCL